MPPKPPTAAAAARAARRQPTSPPRSSFRWLQGSPGRSQQQRRGAVMAAEAAAEPAEPPPRFAFRLEVTTASEVTRLAVCGNFQSPSWDLGTAHDLKYSEATGGCWVPAGEGQQRRGEEGQGSAGARCLLPHTRFSDASPAGRIPSAAHPTPPPNPRQPGGQHAVALRRAHRRQAAAALQVCGQRPPLLAQHVRR